MERNPPLATRHGRYVSPIPYRKDVVGAETRAVTNGASAR